MRHLVNNLRGMRFVAAKPESSDLAATIVDLQLPTKWCRFSGSEIIEDYH